MLVINNQEYISHHGVKGMKWGIRNAVKKIGSDIKERRAAKAKLKEQRTKERGPKRFGVMNAANSAARTHFRRERTNSFKTYRKQSQKQSVKEARLTKAQIDAGRYRVARFRNVAAKTLSVAAGAGAAALLSNPAGLLAIPVVNALSGGMYYSRQQRAYGGTRDKYQTQKRVRNVSK